MISTLKTPVCSQLGCDVPIVLAGMGGVARSELVAAVAAAGGFGFLGMARETPELIRAEINRVRAATTRGFGVNLIPAATEPGLLEAELETVIAEQVAAVTLFWDLRPDIVRRLSDSGCLVLCQVGSVREAEEAATAGAHIVIAQGFEAGGHMRGTAPLADLVRDVVAQVDVPVLAAGGIVDGSGLAAALRWGAQGAVIGTGFLATRESFAHDYHKRRLVEATAGETVHTQAFHVNWPRGAERLNAIVSEARRVLGITEEAGPNEGVPEFSSPACSMHEASDTYMGYAGKAELVSLLNELLEAERAGARVTLESARAVGSGPLAGLLRRVQRDEARWCAMLLDHIKALGENPSAETGAFYGKAMAIADLRERTAFLNRGQRWVVRRLRESLPRVRDNSLHAGLSEMLRSHEANIDLLTNAHSD